MNLKSTNSRRNFNGYHRYTQCNNSQRSIKIELSTVIDNIHSEQTYNYFHGHASAQERNDIESCFNFHPAKYSTFISMSCLIFSPTFLSFILGKHGIVTSNGGRGEQREKAEAGLSNKMSKLSAKLHFAREERHNL